MKKTHILFLLILLIFSFTSVAFAAEEGTEEIALKLYEQGLLSGTGTDAEGNPVFSLDSSLTRQEAVTLLVKLNGAEEEAKSGTWENEFVDVDGWAKPFVGYAFSHGITGGFNRTYFGAKNEITASQYITFILKSLGYSADTDFSWENSWEFSDAIGLTSGEYNSENDNSFLRADAIRITYATMLLKQKAETVSPNKLQDESNIQTVDLILENPPVDTENNTEVNPTDSPDDAAQESRETQIEDSEPVLSQTPITPVPPVYNGDPDLVAFAKQYKGYPYVAGGKGPNGFDCSGFCIYCLKNCGYSFTAGSSQDLYNITERVDASDLKVGDLVFFKGTYATDRVSHSGIYIGNGQMIHAGTTRTGVCIVSLSENYWSNHFYAYGRMAKQ